MGHSTRKAASVVGVIVLLLVVSAGPALAHEHRHVGTIEMVVGWADEPTFVGFKNGVQLILATADKPLLDLGDTLKVEVIFGNEKVGPLPLQRAFGKTYGRPGDYRTPLIPTRAGTYTFHFVGTIKDQKVDQSFTCSEKTFDCVDDAAGIEFPAKDPSRAELAGRVERLSPRIEAVQAAATEAKDGAATGRTLAIVGIVLAAVALVMSLRGGRRQV
jgi:hypothetical protein